MLSSYRTGRCAKADSSGEAGFTLIELLVGVALASIVLVALYATFFTVFRAGSVAGASLDKQIEAGRFLDRVASEIHSAYFDVNNKRTFFRGVIEGMNSTLELTAYTVPVVRKGAPFTDLGAVRYTVEGTQERRLVRESWNPYIGKAVRTVLIEGIDGLQVSYLNGSDWVKAWDGALEGGLPRAVKVAVSFDGGSELYVLARTMLK